MSDVYSRPDALGANPNALGSGSGTVDLSRLVDVSQATTQAINNLNQTLIAIVEAMEAL